MNALKDFAIFCANENLNPDSFSARRAFETGAASISIRDGRPLTMDDIDALTGSAVGTFNVPCPYCGPEKIASTRFKIERSSLKSACYHCFYCGRSGEVRVDGPIDPEKEATARRLAADRANEERSRNLARALRLWRDSEPIRRDDAVSRYLSSRGIFDLPPNVDEVLRFHSLCPFGTGARPCLVGLMRDVLTDEPRAIHRTVLNEGAKSPSRRTLGPIGGAAIKLWPLDGDKLVVGEGIETVLAAATRIEWREPLRPAWALTVANGLRYFPVIEGVGRLVVLVDNDESGTGQKAATECAIRWARNDRDVVKLMPPNKGQDFNDLARSSV